MIRVTGPGGAGKTTIGLALAARLGLSFADLDNEFMTRVGDISAYLGLRGYQAYAKQNIQVYLETLSTFPKDGVFTLSSGFMTYRDDSHPDYPGIFREIVGSPSTVVLLPSFDYEACVGETVRRQLRRPFSRPPEREEQVIRARYGVYSALPPRKFETEDSVDVVVDRLVAHLLPIITFSHRDREPRRRKPAR